MPQNYTAQKVPMRGEFEPNLYIVIIKTRHRAIFYQEKSLLNMVLLFNSLKPDENYVHYSHYYWLDTVETWDEKN